MFNHALSRKVLSIILSVSLVLSSIENVVACVCLEEASANGSKTYAQYDSLRDPYLEPITNSLPQFGADGATQTITHSGIQIDSITYLPR